MNEKVVDWQRRFDAEALAIRSRGSISLFALVELLAWTPLDAHPGLRKVSSVVMSLEEIIDNDGEAFLISDDD